MLRHHRKGRIFFFEEDGSLAQSAEELRQCYMQEKYPDDQPKPVEPDRATEEAWSAQLRKICIGARAIIFFPLWDPQRDQVCKLSVLVFFVRVDSGVVTLDCNLNIG
jgi:hypothetical protein